FVTSLQLEPLYLQQLSWDQELEKLANPLCPGEIGDLPLYTRRLQAVHAKNKQLKQTEKGLRGGKGGPDPEGLEVLSSLRAQMKSMLDEAYAMPCHGCPVQKPCSKQTERIRHLESRKRDLAKRIERETTRYWKTFESLANILRMEGYLQGNSPTRLGETAAAI